MLFSQAAVIVAGLGTPRVSGFERACAIMLVNVNAFTSSSRLSCDVRDKQGKLPQCHGM